MKTKILCDAPSGRRLTDATLADRVEWKNLRGLISKQPCGTLGLFGISNSVGINPGHVQTDSFHSVSHLLSPLVCVPAGGFDAVIIDAAASPSSYCVCIPNIGGGEMTGTPAFPRGAPDPERPWLRAALIE